MAPTAGRSALPDPWIVPCGFPSLAPFLHGGFRAGDLVVVGGDAGSGTSALALSFALRASAMGTRTLVLSSEHTPARLFEQALAAVSRVPLHVLRQGALDADARTAVSAAATHLRERAPVIMRLEGDGLAGVTAAREAARETRLLVVDGLEALLTDPSARDDTLAYAVLACKRLALAHELVVLLTAHLPLLDRSRRELRPTLADFGVRGAIGTHADLVLGLFREELYTRDAAVAGAAELHLLKHRTGDTGYVDLVFDAPCLRFEDVIEA
jgi:replicative DNA helicase